LSLGQVLREYAVTELHLTLNAGSWNYNRWGYPEGKHVGNGAELWAWMANGSKARFALPFPSRSAHSQISYSIDERWQGLRNALAGLFCASLGSMDEQRTTSPTRSYIPEGLLPSWNGSEIHELRHASLPSEHVCTENLTPFLKLLPCKSLSGIATLLNPHRLFDADWHGMGIHVRWLGEAGIEIRLTFQSVMDPLRSSIHSKSGKFAHLCKQFIIC
jgi:phosphatidylinositol glycan class T